MLHGTTDDVRTIRVSIRNREAIHDEETWCSYVLFGKKGLKGRCSTTELRP
jgi:hypothetical protein